MSHYIGYIEVPEIEPSGTFPIVPDYGYGCAHEPEVIVHQFGSGDAKIEQRFYRGPGAKKFTVRKAFLNETDRAALKTFWDNCTGPYGAFTYYAPNECGDDTTPYTCRFEDAPLSWEHLTDSISTFGVTLIEIPSSTPSYTLNNTVERFPSSTLKTALLSQIQIIIPLIKITVRDPNYPVIYLSDRTCTVGGQLYVARLLGMPSGISQSIGNEADEATFLFGNADRVMRDLVNDTQLQWAWIEFSLFHVGTGIKLDLWKGEIKKWNVDSGAEFPVVAADSIHELTLPYPTRKISRTCWKMFNDGVNCPYTGNGSLDLTHFPSANASACDLGYDSDNGCLAHSMKTYFGGIIAEPQGVQIKDNATGTWGFGRATITSTSIVADSIYGQVVPEIYTDAEVYKDPSGNSRVGRIVNAKIAAGREESDFYEALGIVGEGPIQLATSGHTLDGQYDHMYPSSSGRLVNGSDPAGAHEYFSLDQSGNQTGGDWRKVYYGGQTYKDNFAAGTSFLTIRRKDTPGIQLSTPADHAMQAIALYGMTGWVWTALNTRSLAVLTNPVWISVNRMLRARGLKNAAASIAEQYFDVGAAIASAAICNTLVTPLIGITSGTCTIETDDVSGQHRFTIANINTSYPVDCIMTIEGVDYYISAATSTYGVLGSAPDDGTYSFALKERQFKFTGILQEQKPLRDWIQEILMNCLGYFSFAFGKLRIGIRENSSAVEAFTIGNILFGSLSLSGLEPAFNHLIANFADSEFAFAANSVDVFDAEHAKMIGGATAPYFLDSQISLSGTSTKSQAARIIATRLREELGGITDAQWKAGRQLKFKTTVLALNCEPGQVCSMTHEDMPDGVLNGEPASNYGEFRILSWLLKDDLSIEIVGKTTVDEMYDLTVGPKPADVLADPVPGIVSSCIPGAVQNLAVAGVNGLYIITWDDPATGFTTLDDAAVITATDDAFSENVTVRTGYGRCNRVELFAPSTTWFVAVAVHNQSGLPSDQTTPPPPNSFTLIGATGWGPLVIYGSPTSVSSGDIVTPLSDSVLPGVVTNLDVAGGNGVFSIIWDLPTTGNVTIDDAAIQVAADSAFTSGVITLIGYGNSRRVDIVNMPGTSLYFRISVRNQSGLPSDGDPGDPYSPISACGAVGWGPWEAFGSPTAVDSGLTVTATQDTVLPGQVTDLTASGANGNFGISFHDPATGYYTIDDTALVNLSKSDDNPSADVYDTDNGFSCNPSVGKLNSFSGTDPNKTVRWAIAQHNKSGLDSYQSTPPDSRDPYTVCGPVGWGPWSNVTDIVSSGSIPGVTPPATTLPGPPVGPGGSGDPIVDNSGDGFGKIEMKPQAT